MKRPTFFSTLFDWGGLIFWYVVTLASAILHYKFCQDSSTFGLPSSQVNHGMFIAFLFDVTQKLSIHIFFITWHVLQCLRRWVVYHQICAKMCSHGLIFDLSEWSKYGVVFWEPQLAYSLSSVIFLAALKFFSPNFIWTCKSTQMTYGSSKTMVQLIRCSSITN